MKTLVSEGGSGNGPRVRGQPRGSRVGAEGGLPCFLSSAFRILPSVLPPAILPHMNVRAVLKRVLVGRSPRRTLVRALVVGAVAVVVFRFALLPVRLRGESMEPTFHDRSFTLVNGLVYRFREPRRGDVVAIRMAGTRVMLLKRVLGLPGERVAFRDGALVIDSVVTDEPWLAERGEWDMEEVVVGGDEYFVAGDNRAVAIEGHALGRVARERIVGGPLF